MHFAIGKFGFWQGKKAEDVVFLGTATRLIMFFCLFSAPFFHLSIHERRGAARADIRLRQKTTSPEGWESFKWDNYELIMKHYTDKTDLADLLSFYFIISFTIIKSSIRFMFSYNFYIFNKYHTA